MNQKGRLYIITLVLLGLITTFTTSCQKEKTTWDADFTLPIAQTSLTINQLIADSLLVTDANNHLTVVYNSQILNYNIDSLVSIPDTVTTYSLTSSSSGTLSPGQPIANSTEVKSFAFEPARITQVDIEHGILAFNCLNPLNTPLKITYSIPAAKRYGVSFLLSETVPAAQGGVPYHFSRNIDLSDYSLDLRGPTFNNCNRFQTTLTIITDPNGGNAEVTPGQQFTFYTKFDNLQLKYVKGYLGDETQLQGPDTSYIDFFKKITAGSISLSSMDVFLKITNGIGADISMLLQQFSGTNTRTNQSVSLIGEVIGKSYNITRASETHQSTNPVISSVTNIQFNNTNILSFFENLPDLMSLQTKIRINPLGNISCGNDFIYAHNGLTADLSLKIPLTFKANTLTLADTIDYSIGENNTINSGNIILQINNSFPISAKIKLYILNTNLQITDEITLPNQMVSAGSENSNFVPIGSNSSINVKLPVETLQRFLSSKKLLLIAELNTSTSNFVSINANSKIQLKIIGNFNNNMEF